MIVRSYETFIVCVSLYGICMLASRRRNPQTERGVIIRSSVEDLLILSIGIRPLKRNMVVDSYTYRIYYEYACGSSDLLA
jgi:hypothetical protein